MNRPVAVVTGLGVVGPHGTGSASLEAALQAGRPLATEIDRSAGYHQHDSSRLAALVPTLDVAEWLPPAEARRLGVPSRFAVVAARMALADAGIAKVEGRRIAVVLATAFGALLFTEKLVRQILEEGPESAQPFYFSECVANAAAARVAIALGARGANVTITEREAGPLLAVARGAHEVTEGRADLAIVGSAEEMTPLLHALLDRFRSTARAVNGGEAARPFDAARNGILAGEGASMCVIEREDDARDRGARVLARIAATGAAFDATAPVSDWGDGHDALARALRTVIARAGVDSGAIDRVVSGASGARRGDRLESATLAAAWDGRPLPPVFTPKAVVGEFGGGMLAAAVLAAQGVSFGRPLEFTKKDPGVLAVVPHDGSPLSAPRRVLVTALAPGGASAWTLLERP